MNTRDYYAAAALQGIISTARSGSILPTSLVVASALEIADALVAQACERWGHDYEEEAQRNENDVPLRRWCRRCAHQQKREQALSPCGTHCEYGEWGDVVEPRE